jgi:hypothetical protein
MGFLGGYFIANPDPGGRAQPAEAGPRRSRRTVLHLDRVCL